MHEVDVGHITTFLKINYVVNNYELTILLSILNAEKSQIICEATIVFDGSRLSRI